MPYDYIRNTNRMSRGCMSGSRISSCRRVVKVVKKVGGNYESPSRLEKTLQGAKESEIKGRGMCLLHRGPDYHERTRSKRDPLPGARRSPVPFSMMTVAAGSNSPSGHHCLHHCGCKLALWLVQMLARPNNICNQDKADSDSA